ncbi:MAG: long-chain fatty acid--CoA ligase [Microbacteriaceae bacterium]|nr:long-chain fatty acid--CoA ligase [Microbacteriaceae bacterium]
MPESSGAQAPTGPTQPAGIARWVHRRAVSVAEHPAIVFRGEELSYRELADRIDRLGTVLRERGVGPGDRVAYLGNNHPSFVEALFAVTSIGAILVPLNTRLSRGELAYMLEDSGSLLLIATDELAAAGEAPAGGSAAGTLGMLVVGDDGAEGYEAAIAAADPLTDPVRTGLDDAALIIYTSGTTGQPKGAILTHGNLTWNALNVLADYDVVSTDRALMISPLFHVASLGMGLLPVLLKGATVLLQERFVPNEALEAIERLRATTVSGVPTTYQLLAESPRWSSTDISSLRLLTCGGSAVPTRVREAWEARGLAFSGGYGMTESSPGATMLPAAHSVRKAGSSGLPHFFTDVRLAGDGSGAGHVSGLGQGSGEIEVRGPNVFAGYWQAPEKTRDAFTADGWLRTGDIGSMDEDGFLTIEDRLKDMIISGGENVYSAEVELALLAIEGVTGAAVIGIPHETWGEVPHAVVTLAEGAVLDAELMVAALSERLARYKVPRSLEVVDELPRTASGKVQKQVLRDRYRDASD